MPLENERKIASGELIVDETEGHLQANRSLKSLLPKVKTPNLIL